MSTYDVGKGKPPFNTRFKKGNKEYLKRNKPKAHPEEEIFRRVMSETIPIRKGLRVVYHSRMELLIDKIFATSLKGDIRAMESLISLHRDAKERNSISPIILWMTEEDDAVL